MEKESEIEKEKLLSEQSSLQAERKSVLNVLTSEGRDGTNDPAQAVSNPRRTGLALPTLALRPWPGLSCRT